MKLVLHAAAEEDILAAYCWYEERRPGLGEGFVNEVDAAFARIESTPSSFAIS